ncbi:MAG: EthD family reductase [Actinobacteria bacterium]|nr:EthD family reductase [Actinomycetota bacterium]
MRIKMVSPMTRLDGMSREDFREYYVKQHTQVGGGFPGHIKYVGSPAIQSANGDDPPFDAVAELWWESVDALAAAYTHELWERARADHPNVVSGRIMFVVEEHDILEPPPTGEGVKYIALLTRADKQSREDFRRYWFDEHIPLALQTPNLKGYRACPGLYSANGDGILTDPREVSQFDGVVEMFFDSVEAFNESFADPFWDRLRTDYYANFAMGRVQLLVEEHLVFDKITD